MLHNTMHNTLYEKAWVPAGAFLFLGSVVLFLLRGNRFAARLCTLISGAFFEKWGDLRLEKKVADTLAKAEALGSGVSPAPAPAGSWRKP